MNLKKELGALDVFSIAAGAMISSGLFVLPGLIYVQAGPSIILAYMLAAVLMAPNVLSALELATAMPKAGGTYFFIERGLGPLAGTFAGLAEWFSTSLKGAFALVGMGAFAVLLAPGVGETHIKLVGVGCCLVFVAMNLLSVKGAGRIQVFLTLGLLAILVGYVLLGAPRIHISHYVPFIPAAKTGWAAVQVVLMSAGMVFVSYIGVTKVAGISEEVRSPGRNIPVGMLAAFILVSILYVLVIAVTVGLGTLSRTERSLTPISNAAGAFLGPSGRAVLAIGALMAFITTANAAVLAASRSLLAMSRDRLMPQVLARVNERFRTPHLGILITGTFMIFVILFLSIENLVKTASTLMLLLFVLINVSLLVMRASRIQSYRPKFRCPGHPWTQIIAIATSFFLIAEMGAVPLLITCGFAVAGLGWYFAFSAARVLRRSALVHLVERIVDRRLGAGPGTLDAELKEIVLLRDNIVEDRFDKLIKTCTILDIEGPADYEQFFQSVAYHTSQHLHTDADSLYHQLVERERESTTAVSPGLAIPHVIIRGEKLFDILLARCRKGITFAESQPPVHTVFVLLGTRDERSFHLKSLMWIAQIARNPEFRDRWMHARDESELRNIILLATRDREQG